MTIEDILQGMNKNSASEEFKNKILEKSIISKFKGALCNNKSNISTSILTMIREIDANEINYYCPQTPIDLSDEEKMEMYKNIKRTVLDQIEKARKTYNLDIGEQKESSTIDVKIEVKKPEVSEYPTETNPTVVTTEAKENYFGY